MNWKWIPFFSGAIVLLLSFLQASFGEPWNDEVYYWLFAQQCDWGYLDHPPMVAWWIKAGTWIWGDNSFGIRFFFLLSFLFLCSAFLYLKSSLSSHDKLLLLLCIPAYMLAGFLAVPDTPLLFLASGFSFPQKDSLKSRIFSLVFFWHSQSVECSTPNTMVSCLLFALCSFIHPYFLPPGFILLQQSHSYSLLRISSGSTIMGFLVLLTIFLSVHNQLINGILRVIMSLLSFFF